MRKVLSGLFLTVSLFVASILVTMVSLLSDLREPFGVDLAALIQGRLFSLWTSATLWKEYPSLAGLASLFDLRALLLVALLAAAVWYVLAVRRKSTPWTVEGAILAVGLIPYVLGMVVLSGNTDAAVAGSWIATMLLGMLYASLIAAARAGIDLVRG